MPVIPQISNLGVGGDNSSLSSKGGKGRQPGSELRDIINIGTPDSRLRVIRPRGEGTSGDPTETGKKEFLPMSVKLAKDPILAVESLKQLVNNELIAVAKINNYEDLYGELDGLTKTLYLSPDKVVDEILYQEKNNTSFTGEKLFDNLRLVADIAEKTSNQTMKNAVGNLLRSINFAKNNDDALSAVSSNLRFLSGYFAPNKNLSESLSTLSRQWGAENAANNFEILRAETMTLLSKVNSSILSNDRTQILLPLIVHNISRYNTNANMITDAFFNMLSFVSGSEERENMIQAFSNYMREFFPDGIRSDGKAKYIAKPLNKDYASYEGDKATQSSKNNSETQKINNTSRAEKHHPIPDDGVISRVSENILSAQDNIKATEKDIAALKYAVENLDKDDTIENLDDENFEKSVETTSNTQSKNTETALKNQENIIEAAKNNLSAALSDLSKAGKEVEKLKKNFGDVRKFSEQLKTASKEGQGKITEFKRSVLSTENFLKNPKTAVNNEPTLKNIIKNAAKIIGDIKTGFETPVKNIAKAVAALKLPVQENDNLSENQKIPVCVNSVENSVKEVKFLCSQIENLMEQAFKFTDNLLQTDVNTSSFTEIAEKLTNIFLQAAEIAEEVTTNSRSISNSSENVLENIQSGSKNISEAEKILPEIKQGGFEIQKKNTALGKEISAAISNLKNSVKNTNKSFFNIQGVFNNNETLNSSNVKGIIEEIAESLVGLSDKTLKFSENCSEIEKLFTNPEKETQNTKPLNPENQNEANKSSKVIIPKIIGVGLSNSVTVKSSSIYAGAEVFEDEIELVKTSYTKEQALDRAFGAIRETLESVLPNKEEFSNIINSGRIQDVDTVVENYFEKTGDNNIPDAKKFLKFELGEIMKSPKPVTSAVEYLNETLRYMPDIPAREEIYDAFLKIIASLEKISPDTLLAETENSIPIDEPQKFPQTEIPKETFSSANNTVQFNKDGSVKPAIEQLVGFMERNIDHSALKTINNYNTSNLLQSMINAPGVFTPLLHYIIPIQVDDTRAFGELWIDNQKKGNGREPADNAQRYHMFLTFEIDTFGRFETELFTTDKAAEISFLYPDSFKDKAEVLRGKIASFVSREGYALKEIKTGVLTHPHDLIQIFPDINNGRRGFDTMV